jgi:hypothetical protein
MSETTTEALQKAETELRGQVACHLLGKPVTVGDFLDRIATLAAERDTLAARVKELEAALREIASQKKTDELETEYDVERADFEGGYDACIDRARAALTQKDTDNG